MELKDVLSTYTKTVLFGLGAGIFATAVFLTVYYLWYPVFGLVASPQDVNRLIGDMFIAGMHSFAMFALVPILAGAVFVILFYGKSGLAGLLARNALASVIMGFVFYALTTFAVNPHFFDAVMPLLANVSVPAIASVLMTEYVAPMLIQVVEFLNWAMAGAVIAYLLVSRSLIDVKRHDLKNSGAVSVAFVSLAAVAPPAVVYVATVI